MLSKLQLGHMQKEERDITESHDMVETEKAVPSDQVHSKTLL